MGGGTTIATYEDRHRETSATPLYLQAFGINNNNNNNNNNNSSSSNNTALVVHHSRRGSSTMSYCRRYALFGLTNSVSPLQPVTAQPRPDAGAHAYRVSRHSRDGVPCPRTMRQMQGSFHVSGPHQ